MKSKLWVLFKATNKNSFNINKHLQTGNRGKLFRGGAMYLFIVILMLLYSTLYSNLLYEASVESNLQKYVPIVFYIVAAFMVFAMSIYKSKATLFDSKDNDFLFSMPIKPGTILANRVISILLMNYLISIVIFLPSVVVYGTRMGVGALYYVFAIVILLFLPLIPSVLSSLVGYIIAYFSTKVKAKKLIETISTFLIFIIVMLLFSSVQSFLPTLIQNIENIQEIINKYVPLIAQVQQSIFSYDILALLVHIIINLVVFLLFIVILAKGYIKIMLKLKETKTSKKTNKANNYNSTSVTKALVKKEVKKYFGTPIYVFNTFFGIVLLVIATIALVVMKDNILNMFATTGMDMGMISITFSVIFVIMVSLSNTTGSSISLEGNNLWIIKSMPISIKKILNSKILVNIVVVSPITMICSIIIGIILGVSPVQIIITLILIFISNYVVAQFGILANLKYPKFDYTAEAQIVKQSMSAFLSSMVPMIASIALVFGLISLSQIIMPELAVLAAIVLLLGISLLQNLIINKWGIKTFNKF